MDPFHHSSSGFTQNSPQNDEHDAEEVEKFDLSRFIQENNPESLVKTHAGQSSHLNYELTETHDSPYYPVLPNADGNAGLYHQDFYRPIPHQTTPSNSHTFHAGQSSQGNHDLSETNVLPHPHQIIPNDRINEVILIMTMFTLENIQKLQLIIKAQNKKRDFWHFLKTKEYNGFHYHSNRSRLNENNEYYICANRNCNGKLNYHRGFSFVEKYDHSCAENCISYTYLLLFTWDAANHQKQNALHNIANKIICVKPVENINFTRYWIDMKELYGLTLFYGSQRVGENCIKFFIPVGIPLQFKVTWFEVSSDIEETDKEKTAMFNLIYNMPDYPLVLDVLTNQHGLLDQQGNIFYYN
uniref:Uncharacterized protein n=1 Tax=Meloidogyne hapla TaxID=6305 RepID=A0A1I8BB71_MELHA